MTQKQIIKGFIEAWKPVFDAYPELKKIPVYSWGRYYKYECGGEPFEKLTEDGLSSFEFDIDDSKTFDWKLLEKIDDTHNAEGGKFYTGEWETFSPFREDMVKYWDFDSRGGKCVVIIKTDKGFELEVVDCDSPE